MVKFVDTSVKFVCQFTGTKAYNLLGKNGNIVSRIV